MVSAFVFAAVDHEEAQNPFKHMSNIRLVQIIVISERETLAWTSRFVRLGGSNATDELPMMNCKSVNGASMMLIWRSDLLHFPPKEDDEMQVVPAVTNHRRNCTLQRGSSNV